MAISAQKRIQLDELLNKISFLEINHYINRLYNELVISTISSSKLDKIADSLISLVENIVLITSSGENDKDNCATVIDSILKSYTELAKEAGNTFSYDLILSLGGMLLGLMAASIGSSFGFISGLWNDIYNFRTVPTGPITGAATGFLIGAIIGYRAPFSLKYSKKEVLRVTIDNMYNSLESLQDSYNKNEIIEGLQDEIMQKHFINPNNGEVDKTSFTSFLNGQHQYQLLGSEATFLNKDFKGSTGHHSLIKFFINNEAYYLELGSPSDDSLEISQQFDRTTSGTKLIEMLAMHKILQKNYSVDPQNYYNFVMRYRAGENDCLTYVDKILEAVGEPESTISRYTDNDSWLGRVLGSTISFFNHAPKKIAPNENTQCASKCVV